MLSKQDRAMRASHQGLAGQIRQRGPSAYWLVRIALSLARQYGTEQ